MIRLSHPLLMPISKSSLLPLNHKAEKLLTQIALAYDPASPPKFVNIYREGVELEEQGKIRPALEKYFEALQSNECRDKYHKAAICSRIREIEKKEERKASYYKIFGIIATIWAGISTLSKFPVRQSTTPLSP